MKRVRLAPLALAGAALLGAAPATASTGVSIDVGSIAISEQLSPGGEYRLPTFGVRNPGIETTSYEIVVSYLDDQQPLQPPADWFQFSPSTLTLAAGETRAVSTKLEFPPGAEPGNYLALIGPRVASEDEGAQVGAGAAARVTFTVQPSTWLEGALRSLARLLAEHPWIWIAGPLVALLVAARLLRRRFTISVSRRP